MSNMVVRTNIFSLNAHRNMKNVGLEQRRASNRLSSGYRINSAADDAAGLAISENMRAQIRGLEQASINAADGQAMLLTTEGGLEEIGNAVQRIRELIVQASNDTNTQGQRDMINEEIRQLSMEVSSMQARLEFNTNRTLQMGPAIDAEISAYTGQLRVDNMRVSAASAILNENRAQAQEALTMIESLSLNTQFNELNSRQQNVINRALREIDVEYRAIAVAPIDVAPAPGFDPNATDVDFLDPYQTLYTPAPFTDPILDTATYMMSEIQGALMERITNIDGAMDVLADVRTLMTVNAGQVFADIAEYRYDTSTGQNVAWFQVGPNSMQGIAFDFEAIARAVSTAAARLSVVTTLVANPDNGSGIGQGVEVTTLLDGLMESVDDISGVRANLGAVQNRKDFSMRSLDISAENLQDSESRIRNADMAREMMRFTMTNVLQQASISMLSQANQLPTNLLEVLR